MLNYHATGHAVRRVAVAVTLCQHPCVLLLAPPALRDWVAVIGLVVKPWFNDAAIIAHPATFAKVAQLKHFSRACHHALAATLQCSDVASVVSGCPAIRPRRMARRAIGAFRRALALLDNDSSRVD